MIVRWDDGIRDSFGVIATPSALPLQGECWTKWNEVCAEPGGLGEEEEI